MKRCEACNANLLTRSSAFVVLERLFCDEMCARAATHESAVEEYGETVSITDIMGRLTVDQFIGELTDKELIVVFKELSSAIVPKDGAAHELCRQININIDRGTLYISQYTYRRMYVPSLVKLVNKELAKRYVNGGAVCVE